MATVVVALPLLVAVPRVLLAGEEALNGDDALIELKVRDVGGRHTPLVGSYGRFGWNHPGPLLFYVLAVPYRVLGSEFAGMQVGALLLNALAVAGIALIALRRGGRGPLLWSLLLVAVLVHGLGPGALSDPWEPYVTVLPLSLLVLLAFDVAAGRPWSLPVAVGVGSLLAAAQATLLPLVVGLLGWAVVALLVGLLVRRRRGEPLDGRRHVLAAVLAVLAAAVLWAAPVLDELRHDRGNLREMWTFLREPQETLGLADGWRAVALQFDHRAPWLGHDVPLVPLTTAVDVAAAPAVPAALLVVAAATALAAWRRDHSALLGGTALVAVAAGVVGMSQLVGDLFPWLLQWVRVVGMSCWLAAGWCAYRALRGPARARVDRVLLPGLAVAVVAVTTSSVVDAVRHGYDEEDGLQDALVALGEAGAEAVQGTDGPVLVRSEATGGVVFGDGRIGAELVALTLERGGVDVVVDESLAIRYGRHRAEPDRAVAELRVVSGEPSSEHSDGFTVVATADPLSPEERARKERLARQLGVTTPDDQEQPADLGDISRALREDEELRRLVEAYEEIPDLPPMRLLLRRLQ